MVNAPFSTPVNCSTVVSKFSVSRTDQVSTYESNATRPSSLIIKVSPDEGITCMLLGHDGDHYDRNNATNDDQQEPSLLKIWNEAIAKDHKSSAEPDNEDKSQIRMPRLDDEVGMEYRIHLHRDVGGNRDDRRKVEDPAKEI